MKLSIKRIHKITKTEQELCLASSLSMIKVSGSEIAHELFEYTYVGQP